LKYDSQGRFVLPQSLIEYASIKKEITIIGVLNKIEIWNTKLLNEIDKSDNVNDQSYDQLSERVNI
jgi:MraZ protein